MLTVHDETLRDRWTSRRRGKTPRHRWAHRGSARHIITGTIMLVSDLALLEDPAFKAVVEEYAADQSLFFEEYASAWIKLQENGVAEQLRDAL